MKKLVLTGAAGRLGSYCAAHWQNCDESVDRHCPAPANLAENETYVQADLTNLDGWSTS